MLPTKGVLFITKDYACYYAATPKLVHLTIAFCDVSAIQKEATFGLMPNSVKITAWSEKNKKKEDSVCLLFPSL